MNKIKLTVYSMTLLVLLTAIGCVPEYLDEPGLNSYLQDESNGLSVRKESGGLEMKVTYRPTDLLVAQQVKSPSDEDEITALREKYDDYAYFILNMEAAGKDALYGTSTGQGDFSAKLQTLSFRMSDYVNVTTSSQDTIPVADYAFPRTFGLAKSTSLMFVFSREKMKDQEWLSFNLNEFGLKAGDQRFRFKISDLEKVPKLKL